MGEVGPILLGKWCEKAFCVPSLPNSARAALFLRHSRSVSSTLCSPEIYPLGTEVPLCTARLRMHIGVHVVGLG